ncbi:MAG: hydrogenase [Betaproteobacteria bacterium CG2_30_59_46]|nr:MAG: hydrogenase [Betaproteobacteria bacterium CG2_30_59_46]PIQ12781.1 MAG: Ni,Fe-hydrogenase III large subunit [Hydrogenophilales bacterium CG18_big_fil_WC_8_21_14_2_50_58_12]PIY01437.1 MAG: Ni,Fe-hydrogenase III large subunit [Hydrogenophilales bacterium CG_4_10_14_3_um_filter_58_23]PJB04681.1 MAG: Ni,Fe-hydrogenase III large subunit [Hydrogenophilales bacterium CG_4_9_14_3_um_filter_59_35]
MTPNPLFAPFLDHLAQAGLHVESVAVHGLAPTQVLTLPAEEWGRLGQEAKGWGCRWAAGWGEDMGAEMDPQGGKTIRIHACFEKGGAYLLARTTIPRTHPILPSHTPSYPAADRPERHTQDLFGVAFTDHPDARRWTRHQAWKSSEYPLRRDFPAAGHPPAATSADYQYKFLAAQGGGVYEIPVGPVHAGIIEPGHFRFQAVGETVLHLEEHLGYTHKGIEKIAEGRDAQGLARLAGRVSGDSTVAHAWAACMAMERAAELTPPPRATWLRALMCERERVANHLGDIGAIANDVGFAFSFYQFGRLRESWQRASFDAFGHRFMMDRIVPGGVAVDLEPQFMAPLREEVTALRKQVNKLMAMVYDSPSLTNRLLGAGVLAPEQAAALGCMGYVGRASSLDFDVRRNAPYPPYDQLQVKGVLHHTGDVNARMRVRHEEIIASLDLIEALLAGLPGGPVGSEWQAPIAGSEGLGIVEGWRGEIISYARFGDDGRIARFFPRDPSWTTWPALEVLIHDNIVPDFPVCNKSVNGSYSGQDL